MSTHSKVDPSTLGWVKSEIDETLKQARLALEAYAENPADTTRLRFCATHLHQVVGTLLMVELDGAATLAKEVEALADAILNEKAEASDAVLEALTRGILILPDYLARLQAGQPDVPLRHLSLLNELRAARKAGPFAELELFAPDLSVRPPPEERAGPKLSDEDFGALAKQLRPLLQQALLDWLRDNSNKESLQQISEVVAQLQSQTNLGVIEQLLWVAGGLIEALAEDGLQPTNERKKLFARLDQQVKKLIDGTEKSLLRTSSEALVRSMLLELGQAKSTGPRVSQLKRAFELDRLLTGEETLGDLEPFEMPTPEALASVSKALAKEIESAQDLLATTFDADLVDLSALEPMVELLHKMSGTLDMLGVPILKALVDELSEVTRALLDKRLTDPEAVSMPIAQALLLIESSARDIHRSASDWKTQIENSIRQLRALHSEEPGAIPSMEGIEVSDAELTDGEYKQLLGVVADEVGVNLSKIEEALETFAANLGKTQHLDEIPQQLSQIQGALQILGMESVSNLAEVTKQHIESIRTGGLAADSTTLDGLAVCVGTIGAYVEGLRAGRKNLDMLIDTALQELNVALAQQRGMERDPAALVESVRTQLNLWLDDPTNSEAHDRLRQLLDQITALAQIQGQEKIERIGLEMNKLLELVSSEAGTVSTDIADTLRRSYDTLATLANAHLTVMEPATEPAVTSRPEPEQVNESDAIPEAINMPTVAETPAFTPKPAPIQEHEDFDEEILQVFIEDARDVMETIKRELAVWSTDMDNQAALAELRRGYHTLKGSGRMVGATDISELAWPVENMLNKLREGKIQPSQEILQLLHQSMDVIPLLVDHLDGGPAPNVDLETLQETAFALAEPKPNDESSTVAAKATSRQARLPKLDGTLLEIFTNEANGHLNTIRQEIASCREAGDVCMVNEPLFRSTHTLLGNARSLGLNMMVEACAECEKLLQVLKSQELPLEQTHLEFLGQFESAVTELIELLNNGASSADELLDRFAQLTRTARQATTRVIEDEAAESTEPSGDSVPPEPETVASIAQSEPRFRTEADGATKPRIEVDRREDSRPEPTAFRRPVEAIPKPPTATPAVKTEPSPSPPTAAPAVQTETAEEQIDPELLEIFHEEAADILHTVEEALTHWRSHPDDKTAFQDLKRALHTLKGGARMAGVMSMGNLSHNTETLLKYVEDGNVVPRAELIDALEEAHDVLVTMSNKIQEGEAVEDAAELNAKLVVLAGGEAPVPAPEVRMVVEPAPETSKPAPQPEVEVTAKEPEKKEIQVATEPGAANETSTEPANEVPGVAVGVEYKAEEQAEEHIDRRDSPVSTEARVDRRGQIRVNTDLLNNLVNYAGEVSISRSRMEQQIYGFRDNLGELNRNVVRFREQLRELEIQSESQILYRLDQQQSQDILGADFDPLEFDRFSRLQQLARSLTESLHDLTTIQMSMGNFVGEAETVLQQQARINTELQEGLMRTRMINFSTQGARLRHIVRQTARELGKRAELDITGAEVEIDRNVLERMIGPFEHMIRNAIDHGIEIETERKRSGKPVVGRVTINTSQEGNEIVIRFSDDGAGLNIGAIRAKAIERGLMSPDANLTDEEMIQFTLMSGFSTAEKLTHVSGRGVGMDVVHNEVKQLGGSMLVDTKRGKGTTFIIRLPLTLSITQALMVNVGDQIFAVPLSSVVNIIEFPLDKLDKVALGKNPLLNHNEQVYPFMNLGARLNMPSQARNGRNKVPVLLARTGTREVAIQVDGLRGTREIVIKSLGPQLSEIKGLAGATILGDGGVVLILDIPGLWYTDDTVHIERRIEKQQPKQEARERPLIMVVDDSLTVRKVTGKHLQKRGLDVMVAKDGLDAVEQLRDRIPDVMLVDIEMPRMDGYELTTRVRSENRTKHIPIIIITSRAGAKHRKRAFDLGADMYMSKPYQEDELFTNIDTLLAKGRAN